MFANLKKYFNTSSVRHLVFAAKYARKGCFRYFGTNVYFPRKSKVARFCYAGGVYEIDVFNFMRQHYKKDTTIFDIGANLGFHSIAMMATFDTCSAVSVEASPSCIPSLERTFNESGFKERWRIVPKAAGDMSGYTEFFLSTGGDHALDSRYMLQRSRNVHKVTVPMTQVDRIWDEIEKPAISVMKIDVEGGELSALRGAYECIKLNNPAIILEWDSRNLLNIFDDSRQLMHLAHDLQYEMFTLHSAQHVCAPAHLTLLCEREISFLLLPR